MTGDKAAAKDEELETPARLPVLVWVAVLVPSLLVAGFEMGRELGGPAVPVDGATLALLWLFTTLPLLVLALGLRRHAERASGGAPPEVVAAFEAVARAEQVAARSAEAQARLEAALLARTSGAAPEGHVTRAAARRSALLAAFLAGAFVLASVGLAGVFGGPSAGPRAVHLHAAFAVFADGRGVAFDDPFFDLSQRGVPQAHLHVADGYPGVMHIEGPPGLTLAQFFRHALASEMAEDALTLDAGVHGGLRFQENATHRLRLLVQPAGAAAFAEVKPVATFVPRDHDRLLVTFGDERGAALEAQAAQVPARFPP